jgi:cell division protein FtsI (penicillin-binding protein 3)
MNNDLKNSRLVAVFLSFCALYLIVMVNLCRIQIWQHKDLLELGQKQYCSLVTVPVSRAPILDRNGNFLALNKESISACLIPPECNHDQVIPFLRKYFPLSVERFAQQKSRNFMFIKRRLSDQEQKLVSNCDVPGIHLIMQESRYYPLEEAGSIIGITDIDNRGLLGIELAYDRILAGRPATVQLNKDARSGMYYFDKETKKEGHQGIPIKLTIDATTQFLVAEELKAAIADHQASEGCVIVMDPLNGDIWAIANYPDFDPNHTENIDLSSTKNRAVQERYELGSVMKVFAALAALEEGVVTQDEIIDCKNTKTAYVDGRKVNTVHENGAIPFWQVIAASNNIGTAMVTLRLGTKLYDHYKRLGFTEPTGIGFPGEQQGFVNHPDNWSKQSILSLSYGYEIAVTPLQLARAFSIIANGGFMIHPRLILEPQSIQKRASAQRLYSEQSISTIKNILEKTTLQGTCQRARIKGYKVMCKTGTANIITNGIYNTGINRFTCSGIIEKDGYQRVIVAYIKAPAKKGLYAATVATPLFERVAEKILINDKVLCSI